MPIHAHLVSLSEKFWLWCRRHPAIAGMAAVIVFLAPIALAGWLVAKERADAAARAVTERVRADEDSETKQAAEILRASDEFLLRQAFKDTNNLRGPALLNALDEAISRQPVDLAFWQAKITVLTREGRIDDALENLSKAIDLASADTTALRETHIEMLLIRSRLLRQMGRTREAETAYSEAGRINCQSKGIPARNPQTKSEMLDLSPFFESSLSSFLDMLSTDGGEAVNTIGADVKRQTGVEFDLRGGLNLLGWRKNSPSPDQFLSRPPELLTGIAINRRFEWLHVLHSVWGSSGFNSMIAVYVLHYADGQTREIPVLYGHHVRDVWRRDSRPPMEGLVAWQAESNGANKDSRGVQFFKTTWENPRPEVEVQSIDLSLPSKEFHPILLGITVEEAGPGSPEFWTTKAKLLEDQGRFDEALHTYDQATWQLLENPVLWDSKGRLFERAGRTNEAFQAYTKAIEMAARDTNAFLKVLKSALLDRSSVLVKVGRFDEAGIDNCRARRIPIRDPQTRPEMLDLSRFYSSSLSQFLPSRERESTEMLSRVAQQNTGVAFDARGYFGVYGKGVERDVHGRYPQSVEGIPIHRRLTRLHIMHSSVYRERAGTEIGSYILHFADGQSETLPIIYGEDLTEERGIRAPSARAKLAWPGTKTKLPIYQVTWTNPRPDVEIKNLDLVSAMTETSPLLIAITVE